MRDVLVGRSHECDFPAEVKTLPQCTEPRFSIEGSSQQIDDRVKNLLRQGLSVYLVDAEKLKQLNPDLILTQIQCQVCAVSEQDVEAAVCDWLGTAPRIVSLNPNRLDDFWQDIRLVADALEIPQRGAELIARLQNRMQELSNRATALSSRPRLAVIEWISPMMGAGNWMPELVEMAGGIHLFGEAGQHSPFLSLEELNQADPDVILVTPCGFDISRTWSEMPQLAQKPEWRKLRAVQSGQVHVADGNQFFNRPGPRLLESLEILAEILHPEVFDFGHRGRDYRVYQS
jgi:iron complex transport system substrate-binding protein